ncbi:hypothetical protein ACFX1T_009442 [Malus domestica]
MKESSDGFVRADQIDLKSLDEQLERHLTRVLTLEKSKIMRDSETNSNSIHHPRHVHFLHDPLHPKMPPPEVGDRPLQAPHQVCHYSPCHSLKLRVVVRSMLSTVPEKHIELYDPSFNENLRGVDFIAKLSEEVCHKTIAGKGQP